jgi:broad specificity phosphatase PhoE
LPLRADDGEGWKRLREGRYVILIRHASTVPGLGDPSHFRLDDCATQRNLSEAGREEARRVGERFRAERVKVAKVYTSPWCRCRETAMLAFGRGEDWEPLSSFFDFPHREAEFTERVKKRIGGYSRKPMDGNVVMVTHNVNIAAISKHSVAQGEMVIMRPDGCCDARPMQRLKA